MTRDDVVRITESVLKELCINVSNGDFTNPNSRKIELLYRDEVISTDYFDVVQTDEYEG